MANEFYEVKLRNEITGEYIALLGKVTITPVTFGHVKVRNIYGRLTQRTVSEYNKTSITIDLITNDEYLILRQWFKKKSSLWIESNKDLVYGAIVDTELGLTDEFDNELGIIVWKGNINLEG